MILLLDYTFSKLFRKDFSLSWSMVLRPLEKRIIFYITMFFYLKIVVINYKYVYLAIKIIDKISPIIKTQDIN